MTRNTGFDGDSFDGVPLDGLYAGTVSNRDDPEGWGRVRVEIPGVIDGESAWARPRGGGGYRRYGKNDVPPLGAEVLVQFVNGRPDWPVYETAGHGAPGGESDAFPEHEHPDIHVFGRGPFRLVLDNRDEEGVEKTATFKVVKEIEGEEIDVAWVLFNYDKNSIQIHAESAVGVDGVIFDVDCPTVQLNGRTLMTANRPIK